MQAESNVVGADEEEPGFLVRITGFSTQTTKDALLNFFENTRRSGGGEIKEIQLSQDEGFTDIVFWHNEDARRVAQNDGLQLDGANLAATLKKIPKERPVDQRRLHVLGISDKTTKDGLISFMEVVSGEEVETISFGNHSNVMVCFKETIDFHEVQKMCKTNSLDENFLTVEEVKTCDCIEVTGFACNTTKDAILYYFKNKRKGGGVIKDFEEIESPERKMLVSFEDPKVVDNVMNQQDHVIDGAHLTVNRYYSFLGETSLTNPKGGGRKERIVRVDPQSMLFIEEFFGEELSQLLQECRVKYTWQEGSREIVLGCAEPKLEKTTWENSCDAFVSYINQIVTEKIYTTQEIWEQMRNKAKEKGIAFGNEIQILYTFDFKKKDLSIQLRGKKTSVGVLAKQLQDFISQIEKEILLEKSKITKKIKLSEAQMDMLSFCGFVEDLKNRHQGLEVTMTNDSNEQAIRLRGQEDEVNEGNVTVWQALSNVKESEIELPKSIISILRSETGKVFIVTNFKNNNVEAVVGFDSRFDTLVVTAVDRNNLKNAIDLIKEVTAEEGIPLHTEQKQLIGSNKWKELMHSIQDSMLLRATEDPESSMLLLAGIKQEVETAKEKVEEFFDENLISNKVIDAETGRVKFIFKFNLVAIKDIEDALKKYSVKLVKSDERSGKVLVSGTRKGIEQAVPKAETLINNVKDRVVAIDATVLREIDQGKEWLEFLDGVENKYNSVIERLTEPRSMYDSLNVGPLGSELERVTKLKLQLFAADTIVVQKIEDEINDFLEDNRKVVEWDKPMLDGCPLTLTRLFQPKKTISLNDDEEEESEKPAQQFKVVRVLGISDNTTKEALLNFFENTRRSGGGEIEDIQHIPDERMADITFCSPHDAERVSQKRDLKLDGCGLTVTLKEIPKEIPKDPYKLHVMGISKKSTKNGLTSFMEVVSGEEVESMLFGSNSNVMVTFKEPPDLEKLQKKCSKRALDGSHLKIEQVNICDCIEVTGLAPNTNKDTVFFYFDNPRNGGGEVKSVEMDLENARAMLFFEDPSVVNNVTRQEHIVNGTKLEVAPYYPFLGKTSNDPKVMKIKVVKEQKKKKDRRKFVDKKTAKKEAEEDAVCPICLDGFHDPTTLPKCNHKFCRLCIEQAFQHRKVCPTCGMGYGDETGNMPNGTMNYSLEPYLRLPGYERYGAIRIDYNFPSGTQGPEHPNPGQWYSGTSRSAYLPDCTEGREVLCLLKKAFDARLTFTIGRSETTGASNVVTWNGIHHKTSPYGGVTGFGYPDPTYLKRVKAELSAKGIS